MLGRMLGRVLADPVIVMVKPEAFWDMVEEVRRDAVDFPLEVRQDRDPKLDYQRSLSPGSPPKG